MSATDARQPLDPLRSAAMLVLLMIVFAVARFLLPMLEGETRSRAVSEPAFRSRGAHEFAACLLGRFASSPGEWMQVYATDGRQPRSAGNFRISLALLPLLWEN
jgi:hypothetical protein